MTVVPVGPGANVQGPNPEAASTPQTVSGEFVAMLLPLLSPDSGVGLVDASPSSDAEAETKGTSGLAEAILALLAPGGLNPPPTARPDALSPGLIEAGVSTTTRPTTAKLETPYGSAPMLPDIAGPVRGLSVTSVTDFPRTGDAGLTSAGAARTGDAASSSAGAAPAIETVEEWPPVLGPIRISTAPNARPMTPSAPLLQSPAAAAGAERGVAGLTGGGLHAAVSTPDPAEMDAVAADASASPPDRETLGGDSVITEIRTGHGRFGHPAPRTFPGGDEGRSPEDGAGDRSPDEQWSGRGTVVDREPGAVIGFMTETELRPTSVAGDRLSSSETPTRSVVDQIAHRVSTIVREGRQDIALRLDPPELGGVRVEASLDGQRLSLHIRTEHESARELLEQGLPRLRESLSQHGLLADQVTVQLGLGTSPRDAWGGGAPGWERSALSTLAKPEPDGRGVSLPSQASIAEGLEIWV